MAIDTRDKRFSMASLMGNEILPHPPTSGGMDADSKAERQQWGGYYSGINAIALVILPWYYKFIIDYRRDGYA